MNRHDRPTRYLWSAWRVAALAVAVNILVHLGLVTAGLLAEGGGSLMERARIYTDEVPAPINPWSMGFHLPAWLAAAVTLASIDDRSSPVALIVPQAVFLVVSSAQTALVAAGLFRLWRWGGARLRRRSGTGG